MPAERGLGYSCLCVPLRLAVTLIAAFYFAYGFVCLVGFFSGEIRIQGGGYNPHTRRLPSLVGAFGTICGLLGIVGSVDGNLGFMRVFANFQDARLVAAAIVFVMDNVSLTLCSTWAQRPDGELRNSVMYAVSAKGACDMARFCYTLGFLIDFSIGMYFAWLTRIFIRKVDVSPGYLIRFDQTQENHSHMKLFDPSGSEPRHHLASMPSRPSEAVYGAA
mmetsp:Transcript_9783/g.18928  ORF Transcript_9783/g.18928 Transcript_9783/m.18928 type:complete len:219 (-) Transcript_9783:80-736(-)|eukprot:CAMPEP_0172712808 /NCGR_PEP_ID=MMETSP1074-20121228/61315_1 /TAXON_ID=2916 /ORGANISM="Ceratium fusus, Strain PA161109" /LENGTH=218 /DNA_ID=CAMNT_0013536787 /DNA_START=111 /DNA_END=767 /DNA_ORIENTATION=-